MTGLAHISRFTHKTARQIIENPGKHTNLHLRAACVWLVIHGDEMDVTRAGKTMRSLDRGEEWHSLPPRSAKIEKEVRDQQRAAVFASVAEVRAHRLAIEKLEDERRDLEACVASTDLVEKALIAFMAVTALAAALGFILVIGGRP